MNWRQEPLTEKQKELIEKMQEFSYFPIPRRLVNALQDLQVKQKEKQVTTLNDMDSKHMKM